MFTVLCSSCVRVCWSCGRWLGSCFIPLQGAGRPPGGPLVSHFPELNHDGSRNVSLILGSEPYGHTSRGSVPGIFPAFISILLPSKKVFYSATFANVQEIASVIQRGGAVWLQLQPSWFQEVFLYSAVSSFRKHNNTLSCSHLG